MALLPSKGTVRNDIGAYGGLFTKPFPSLDMYDIRVSRTSLSMSCSPGQQVTSGVELLNHEFEENYNRQCYPHKHIGVFLE